MLRLEANIFLRLFTDARSTGDVITYFLFSPTPPPLSPPYFRLNPIPVAYPEILFGGGGDSTNLVEDRENGDLGAVVPSQGFWRQL